MHNPPHPGAIDGVTNTTSDSASPAPAVAPAVAPAAASEPGQHADGSSGSSTHAVAAMVLAAGASTRLGAGRSKQLLRYQGQTLLRRAVEQALASSCRPVIVVLGAEAERCLRELDGLEVRVALNPSWAEGMGASIRAGMTALASAAPDARAVVITLCDQPLVTGAFVDRLVQRYLTEAAAAAAAGAAVATDAEADARGRNRAAGFGGSRAGLGGHDDDDEGLDTFIARERQGKLEPTIAAEYEGRPGVPALFPRSRFEELSRLDGAAGARHLLRAPMAAATSRTNAGVGASASASANAGAATGAASERVSSRVVTLPCPEAAVDVDTITDYEALPQ
jgi:CTP:molybdopterin cytidylyltransferase MocA